MSGFGRILLLGCGGQLGRELQRTLADAGELVCHTQSSLDLTNGKQLRSTVRSIAPDLIVNAAAYTAVDRAEAEPQIAMAVNGTAVGVLAEEAARIGALLVHFSTDYVFDGSKIGPWDESDKPNPLNEYGRSKLAGEELIRRSGVKHLILRTSWVYGPHGHNFLSTILKVAQQKNCLKIVDDQIGAPTSSCELAAVTRLVLERVRPNLENPAWSGTYHMTCAGAVSWYGFACAILSRTENLLERTPEVIAIPSKEYPTPAIRPRNSVLANSKLQEAFDVRLQSWEEALDDVICQLS